MEKLPELKYSYDSLEPYIDEKTMILHHTKHHKGYVDKYNNAIKETEYENKNVIEVIKNLESIEESKRTTIKNNGGGHINHSIFWKLLNKNGKKQPEGKLLEDIKNVFGSFEKFLEEFKKTALNHFGSGWAWLVYKDGSLKIYSTLNQDNPFMKNEIPILGLDVWEHAYYLKYQNRRNEYIESFFEILDWSVVEENYEYALKGEEEKIVY